MSIYTRAGDTGTTSLVGGERVSKADARVEAYGAIDEANSALGLAIAAVSDIDVREVLTFVQQRLFNCASSLATPPSAVGPSTPGVTEQDTAALERAIDLFGERAGTSGVFVLEGGCEAAVRLHMARAIVRRAERRIVRFAAEQPVDDQVLRFLNRCSDLLYAAARFENTLEDVGETAWDANAPIPDVVSGRD